MPTLNWLTRDKDIGTAKRVAYRLFEEVPERSIRATKAIRTTCSLSVIEQAQAEHGLPEFDLIVCD